jgi:gas vesicle protein
MTDYERIGDYQAAEEGTIGLALTFLFIGLGVGALAALLLTPRTGKQMRRGLRRRYEDARDTIGDWGDQANEIIDKGAGWASAAKDKVTPLSKAIRGN